MAEMTETFDKRPASPMENTVNDENESGSAKLLKSMCRNTDKSGDWNNSADAWYINSREFSKDIFNLESENSTEWKYKNLYSMSTPNYPAFWSPSRHAVAMTPVNILQTKPDVSTKENENYLDAIREYLVNYQESCGTPRGEYSFAALLKVMGQAVGRSLLALFYIVANITPIAEIFLYILRFVLDKIISIRNTNDYQQAILKYAILGLQLLCVYVCLVFIFGFIVMPILKVVLAILAKVLLYD